MTTDVTGEIETALQVAQQDLPQILAMIGMFYPPALVAAKFLPLLGVAIQAVNTVAQATGATPAAATTAVVNHLTPGATNAPSLQGTAS